MGGGCNCWVMEKEVVVQDEEEKEDEETLKNI